MKKIVLSLVTLSSLVLLAACGSNNTASTSKSSSKTSTSQTSSSSKTKAKTQNSSAKENSQASSAESSQPSSASQAASAEPAKKEETAKTESATPAAAVPAEVVGTWTASNEQAKSVSMTIGADGSISVEANYGVGDTDDIRTYTANGTAVEVRPGLYRWVRNGGDYNAFLAGVTGLGGANFKAEEGFLLQSNQYIPVWFTAAPDQEFDYANNYNAFTFGTLTKQE